MVDPNLSKSFCDILVIFANLASCEAPSSPTRLVALLKSIIVFVKPNILSVSIPSCPAASATPAISVALDGKAKDILLIPRSNSANCFSVPSTVFFTPAKALSQST